VREVLPQWLEQASKYSGDDTTLTAALRHVSTVTGGPPDSPSEDPDAPPMDTERNTET
jgi:hypothetical protein